MVSEGTEFYDACGMKTWVVKDAVIITYHFDEDTILKHAASVI